MNEEKKKLDGMEISKSKENAHCMHGHDRRAQVKHEATMWCANHDDQNLTTGLCAHGITRASIHVLRFALCGRVLWVLVVSLSLVSCVLSLGFTTHMQYQV